MFCGLISGCSGVQLKERSSLRFFHTTTVWVYDKSELSERSAASLWEDIKSDLAAIEYSLSTEAEGGSVYRFNRAKAGESVEIDGIAYEVFSLARELYQRTGGAYNPAEGLLVDLWGFSPRFSGNYTPNEEYDRNFDEKTGGYALPDLEYIEQFSKREMTNFSAVRLTEVDGKFYAEKPKNAFVCVDGIRYDMQVNFGGLGKGYAVDCVQKLLSAHSLNSGYFSVGGSSMLVLNDPRSAEGAWRVNIVNPRPKELGGEGYCAVSAKNSCLSSSGDYENFYAVDGLRYCHILDVATGYPVNALSGGVGVVSASVFGLSAAEGDATTTALMVMGKERAINYLKEGIDGVFLYCDGDEYTLYTSMADELTPTVEGMEVVRIYGA